MSSICDLRRPIRFNIAETLSFLNMHCRKSGMSNVPMRLLYHKIPERKGYLLREFNVADILNCIKYCHILSTIFYRNMYRHYTALVS